MNKLIGLTGKKQSGKTTVANYLEEEYGYISWAFADPIKLMVSALITDTYDFNSDRIDDWEDGVWKETPIPSLGGVTPRFLAQSIGACGRAVDEKLWINKVAQDIASFEKRRPDLSDKILLTDVRLQPEAKWVRENDGVIIELHRGSINAKDDDVTEQGVRENLVNHIIFNNKSLERLYESVDVIMDGLHIEKIRSTDTDS